MCPNATPLSQSFTTTEVGRFLSICATGAMKLIDGGHLLGWRTPGGKDRRVDARSLATYLAANADYLGFLRSRSVVPEAISPVVVAAIVAEADRLAATQPR